MMMLFEFEYEGVALVSKFVRIHTFITLQATMITSPSYAASMVRLR